MLFAMLHVVGVGGMLFGLALLAGARGAFGEGWKRFPVARGFMAGLSVASASVLGIVGLVVGYHALVEAYGVVNALRAPWLWVVGVSVVAVVGSLWMDVVERASDARHAMERGEAGEESE